MANNIVVLTGAGISAESGLKTFRDNDGLWEGHRVESVATPEAFERDPHLVHDFYNQRRAQLQTNSVKPNAAHVALAKFEQAHTGAFTLITQNVDNLHQRAGSHTLAMHGELLKAQCSFCLHVCEWLGDIQTTTACPNCAVSGGFRPHIVWFGEMPLHMEPIEEAILACDLFISIGTSGVVYPAAGFCQLAKHIGAKTVELNLEPGDTASQFDECYYGNATDVVARYLSELE